MRDGSTERRDPRAGWRLAAPFACACMLLGAPAARAGGVAIEARNTAGAAAEDAVLVFDPLDATPPPGHGAAAIDQINKKFSPKVSVVRTGTAITFPNSDQIRHQVYSFSTAKPFSLKLYAGSPRAEVLFDHPGLVILGCNIHDQMVGFVAVVDTPYFAKTDAKGKASLDLPPGHYRLRVWHAAIANFNPRPVTVGSDGLTIPLTLDLDPSRDTAVWPD